MLYSLRVSFCTKLYGASFGTSSPLPRQFFANAAEATHTHRKGKTYPFVKPGRLINPAQAAEGGRGRRWTETGWRETVEEGGKRKGGQGAEEVREGARQRKEGDAGCVRVVPCGIRRSQVRHAFLLRS